MNTKLFKAIALAGVFGVTLGAGSIAQAACYYYPGYMICDNHRYPAYSKKQYCKPYGGFCYTRYCYRDYYGRSYCKNFSPNPNRLY